MQKSSTEKQFVKKPTFQEMIKQVNTRSNDIPDVQIRNVSSAMKSDIVKSKEDKLE